MVKRLIIDQLWYRGRNDKFESDDMHIFSFLGNTIIPFNTNFGIHDSGVTKD